MITIKEGIHDNYLEQFFTAINQTSMKRNDYNKFEKAYKSRNVVISLWNDNELTGFETMITDWVMNSMIFDVVVVDKYKKQGYGKRIMTELMKKAPDSRFYLTSTFGHEEFYQKLGFRKHKTAYALYPTDSPYLE